MTHPEPHPTDCDCGDCCADCGSNAANGYISLNDDGRCFDCSMSRDEYKADMIYESMKYGE